jgi:hypothetical protein
MRKKYDQPHQCDQADQRQKENRTQGARSLAQGCIEDTLDCNQAPRENADSYQQRHSKGGHAQSPFIAWVQRLRISSAAASFFQRRHFQKPRDTKGR